MGRDKFDYSINSTSPCSQTGKENLDSCRANITPRSLFEDSKTEISVNSKSGETKDDIQLIDDLLGESSNVLSVESSKMDESSDITVKKTSIVSINISSSSDDSDFEINKLKYRRITKNPRKNSLRASQTSTPADNRKTADKRKSDREGNESGKPVGDVSPRPLIPRTLTKKRQGLKKKLLTPEKVDKLRRLQQSRKETNPAPKKSSEDEPAVNDTVDDDVCEWLEENDTEGKLNHFLGIE